MLLILMSHIMKIKDLFGYDFLGVKSFSKFALVAKDNKLQSTDKRTMSL